MGSKKRRVAVATLDELGGVASKKVGFIRTDAKALVAPSASNTKLKASLVSSLEPAWPHATSEQAQEMLQSLAACAFPEAGRAQCGLIVGLNAVSRALRRGELRCVILGREAPQPLLSAHLAVLAQQQSLPACMLPCDSGRLGQPFGLLRASVLGLASSVFDDSHPTVQLVVRVCGAQQPLPWLPRTLELRASRSAAAEGEVPSEAAEGEAPSEAAAAPVE